MEIGQKGKVGLVIHFSLFCRKTTMTSYDKIYLQILLNVTMVLIIILVLSYFSYSSYLLRS